MAEQVINYSISDVGLVNVRRLIVERVTDPDTGDPTVQATVEYFVPIVGGGVHKNASLSLDLTPAAKTALGTFIVGTALPLVNEHEGFV